jgi:predicted nucleic acid-binding protein
VTHKIISNSTPLIALSKINRLHIIKELFGTITIPEARPLFDENNECKTIPK